MSAQRETGPVKWFDKAKGYGFVTRSSDQGPQDVLVHYNAIRGEGFRLLYEGQIVEYTLQKGPKGLQAEDVILLNETTSAEAEENTYPTSEATTQESTEEVVA